MKMNYRYEISQENLGEYRNTTLSEKFETLDPDGFVCDESTGDRILEAHGWTAEKTIAE